MSELKSIKMFGDTIINLTPHDVTYDTGTTTIVIPKNDVPPVRIKDSYSRHTGMVGPFQVEYTNGQSSAENLPDEQYSVYYIVSTLVRKQLPHRKDLLSPTTNEEHIVKNELGHTISVSYFEMNI